MAAILICVLGSYFGAARRGEVNLAVLVEIDQGSPLSVKTWLIVHSESTKVLSPIEYWERER